MKFLVKTHEYSKMFTAAKSDDFYNCIDCCMDTINTLRNVLDVIQEAKAGELDEWSEIDAYEESMIENTTGISWVQQCRFSKYSSINYCYGTLVNRIRAYNEKLKDFLALGIYANDAWRDSLCKLAKNILGIIMYILWFDYGIETTAEECCSSDEIEIDIALSSYCDAKGIDKLSFIEELIEYRAEYKYSFSIFEDYPELEESFISMMGPYLGGVDDSKLTVEQVQSVCSGKKTPEELVNEFLSSDSLEDSDDLDKMTDFL